MKRVFLLLVISLFVFGCASSEETVVDYGADDMVAEGPAAQDTPAESAPSAEADMAPSNFKCNLAGSEDYYFLDDKVKIVGPNKEMWLIDDVQYVKETVDGKEVLGRSSGGGQVSISDVRGMYDMSKTSPMYECTLGGVTEEMVALPDLDIVG